MLKELFAGKILEKIETNLPDVTGPLDIARRYNVLNTDISERISTPSISELLERDKKYYTKWIDAQIALLQDMFSRLTRRNAAKFDLGDGNNGDNPASIHTRPHALLGLAVDKLAQLQKEIAQKNVREWQAREAADQLGLLAAWSIMVLDNLVPDQMNLTPIRGLIDSLVKVSPTDGVKTAIMQVHYSASETTPMLEWATLGQLLREVSDVNSEVSPTVRAVPEIIFDAHQERLIASQPAVSELAPLLEDIARKVKIGAFRKDLISEFSNRDRRRLIIWLIKQEQLIKNDDMKAGIYSIVASLTKKIQDPITTTGKQSQAHATRVNSPQLADIQAFYIELWSAVPRAHRKEAFGESYDSTARYIVHAVTNLDNLEQVSNLLFGRSVEKGDVDTELMRAMNSEQLLKVFWKLYVSETYAYVALKLLACVITHADLRKVHSAAVEQLPNHILYELFAAKESTNVMLALAANYGKRLALGKASTELNPELTDLARLVGGELMDLIEQLTTYCEPIDALMLLVDARTLIKQRGVRLAETKKAVGIPPK